MITHSKEDDNRRKRNPRLKRRRKHIIIPRPERKIPPAHNHPRQPTRHNRRPDIRQVVRRPDVPAREDDDGVQLGEPVRLGQPARRVVVDDGEGQADGEGGEDRGVLGALAKDFARGEGAEEDGGGEVAFDAGAGEAVFLVGFADVVDAGDLEVHHAGAYQGGYNGYDSQD